MKNLSIQEYFSLGYMYLLILGIITDSIFYNYLGINILNYSNISDVLISPINLMMSNVILTATFFFSLGLSYLYITYIVPKMQKKLAKEEAKTLKIETVPFLAVFCLCLFLGLGIGRGTKNKALIESGKIKMTHLITFSDSKQIEVKIIGQNTAFVFYVLKNGRSVIVSPIGSGIQQIQRLSNK
jgi:cell shape-determining protein MreD